MKINKYKIIIITFIIAVICVFGDKSYANKVELSKKGTIEITLKHDEELIRSAEITIYKVANAKMEEDNIKFSYNEPFKDFEININDINSDTVIKNLTQIALENNAKGITATTDETGRIEVDELEVGVYLVTQTKSVNNYYDFKPYLVKIPYDDNGVWKYDVSSEPKIEKREEQPSDKPQDSNVAGDNDDTDKADKLIQTGQQNMPILIFSSIGILFIIIGIVIIAKRRNDEN